LAIASLTKPLISRSPLVNRFLLLSLAASACLLSSRPALAVDPNPLQSAYWRFEEGAAGSLVATNADVVLDSINDNRLRAYSDLNVNAAPRYTATVAPFPLKSGLPNALAFDFTANAGGGGDDLYANSGESGPLIRNGMIGGPNGAGVTGYTLEAAFRPDVVGGPFQGIVAKEGQPNGPLPTLALKVRGDSGNLQIEQFDQTGTARSVESASPLVAGNWYAAAVVNDGQSLSLYLNDGAGYVLQGSTAVSGALYQGAGNDNWDHAWTIGRAAFNGSPADWFDGIVDEVRLTNRVLGTNEFLFAPIPEPSSAVLIAAALAGFALRARRR
jgi:hypothetical protein